jgi:hypothetical protein
MTKENEQRVIKLLEAIKLQHAYGLSLKTKQWEEAVALLADLKKA